MLEPFHGPFREGHGQLNPENSGHAKWLQASTNGHVLMISGNDPVITETRLDMDPATGRAPPVTGYVPRPGPDRRRRAGTRQDLDRLKRADVFRLRPFTALGYFELCTSWSSSGER